MQVKKLNRVFLFNGMRLVDPGADMSPAMVKDFYAAMYPELTTAEVSSAKETDNDLEYTFIKTTGTKGRKAKPEKKEVEVPFAERLQAAANEKGKQTEAEMVSLASTLYQRLSRKGEPLVASSAALPLLL